MSQDRILATIESIYDAGLDEACWPEALENLAELIGSAGATIAFQDSTGKFPVCHYTRSAPAAQQAYADYYRQIDPILAFASRAPCTVITDRTVLPKADLRRTVLYNEFARPNNMESVMQAFVLSASDCAGIVAAARPPSAAEFDDDHVRILELLLPHLARAMRLHLRLKAADVHKNTTIEALNRLTLGIMLLDRHRRILFANTAAEAVLAQADGLGTSPSGLHAATAPQSAALQQLVDRAANRGSVSGRGGILRIDRPSMKSPLLLHVLPAGAGAGSSWIPEPRPVAIVFVSDPEQAGRQCAPYLNTLYSLTPAEAAVAEAIARGQGVPEAAESLHVAPSTLRWHLQRVFDKTGTSRQAELARLVERLGGVNSE